MLVVPLGALLFVLLAGYFAWSLSLARTADLPFLLPMLLILPYWSLLGGIQMLFAKLIDPTIAANRIESAMFPVNFGEPFLIGMASYVLFLFVVLAVLQAFFSSQGRRPFPRQGWMDVAHRYPHHVAIAFLAPVIAWFAITVGGYGSEAGLSLYLERALIENRLLVYAKVGSGGALAMSIVLFIVGYQQSRRSLRVPVAFAYGSLAVAWLFAVWRMGDRGQGVVFAASLAIGVIALGRDPGRGARVRLRLWLTALTVSGLTMVLVAWAGLARIDAGEGGIEDLGRFFDGFGQIGPAIASVVDSGELHAAFLSLFGVIDTGARGSLDQVLFNSYSIYASQVGLPSGRGFAIHPVAAWWMIVGAAAPLLAGLQVAGAAALLGCLARLSPQSSLAPISLPAIAIPAMAVPVYLLRGGPDNVWGLALSSFILPGLLLSLPIAIARRRAKRDASSIPKSGPIVEPDQYGCRGTTGHRRGINHQLPTRPV